jgi:hypothetical protein
VAEEKTKAKNDASFQLKRQQESLKRGLGLVDRKDEGSSTSKNPRNEDPNFIQHHQRLLRVSVCSLPPNWQLVIFAKEYHKNLFVIRFSFF